MKSKKGKKAFSRREAILFAVLGVVILGVCYYSFFYSPTKAEIADCQSQTEMLQSQTLALSARVQQVRAMQDAVANAGSDAEKISIPDYDNSKNVIAELNEILSSTNEFKLGFGTVTRNDYIYERPVQLTFSTYGYQSARNIITALDDSEFFNQISDVSITLTDGNYDSEGNYCALCLVSLTITYFEVDG